MYRSKTFVTLLLMVLFASVSGGQPMVKVDGGDYKPLYGTDAEVHVDAFMMDVYPVTQREFSEFVARNPKWVRGKVIALYADKNYLSSWATDTNPGSAINPLAPVTQVSWFVAKEYCKSLGKRLPTLDEWEFVAMANENKPDARSDSSFNQYILSWYEKPVSRKTEVGMTFKNYWGIYDIHGLVWEWTYDFNSVLLSGESRKDVDTDNSLFCGSAAVGTTELMNYAAFMRYAFRGSVKANYAINNLGFRCAQSIK